MGKEMGKRTKRGRAETAALPMAGITALGALDLSEVAEGQWLVVMGATGGVGGYAVQLARKRGAHVIATVHRDADEYGRLAAQTAPPAASGNTKATTPAPWHSYS